MPAQQALYQLGTSGAQRDLAHLQASPDLNPSSVGTLGKTWGFLLLLLCTLQATTDLAISPPPALLQLSATV